MSIFNAARNVAENDCLEEREIFNVTDFYGKIFVFL